MMFDPLERANVHKAVMTVVHGLYSTNPQMRIAAMALLTDMAMQFVAVNFDPNGSEYEAFIPEEFMPAIMQSPDWERN